MFEPVIFLLGKKADTVRDASVLRVYSSGIGPMSERKNVAQLSNTRFVLLTGITVGKTVKNCFIDGRLLKVLH